MITIRPLTEKDEQTFKQAFTKALSDDYSEYSKTIKNYFSNEKNLQKEFNLPFKLGAFDEENLAGYMLLTEPEGGVLYIRWLNVLKDYQKQGIGKILLAEAEKIAKENGCHALHLESDIRNVKYYEARGYKVVGFEEKGYFGTDNYNLAKHIAEPEEQNFLR